MAKRTNKTKVQPLTPEQEVELKSLTSKYDQRESNFQQAMSAMREVMSSWFVDPHKRDAEGKLKIKDGQVDTLCVSRALAELLADYDFDDERGMNPLPLYMEWMADEYVGKKCKKLITLLRKIHDICVERGITHENYYDFNDLDNKVFYVPAQGCKVLCTTDQNTNFIAVFDQGDLLSSPNSGKLHIRQYFDVWEPSDDDIYNKETEREYRKGGIEHAILHASTLMSYSDAILDNKYVHRPSLAWFQSRNFRFKDGPYEKGCGYGDVRDPGYVLSVEYGDFYENLVGQRKADHVIHFLALVRTAFMDFECALACLQSE